MGATNRTLVARAEWTNRVLVDVIDERRRQDAKWGEQNHPPEWWLAIAAEEFGELAQEILADRFGSAKHGQSADPLAEMRKEAVQLAATAVAFVEHLDRRAAGVTPHPTGPTFTVTDEDVEAGRAAASKAMFTVPGTIHDATTTAARAVIESFIARKTGATNA